MSERATVRYTCKHLRYEIAGQPLDLAVKVARALSASDDFRDVEVVAHVSTTVAF